MVTQGYVKYRELANLEIVFLEKLLVLFLFKQEVLHVFIHDVINQPFIDQFLKPEHSFISLE